jgi:hypothetical protein
MFWLNVWALFFFMLALITKLIFLTIKSLFIGSLLGLIYFKDESLFFFQRLELFLNFFILFFVLIFLSMWSDLGTISSLQNSLNLHPIIAILLKGYNRFLGEYNLTFNKSSMLFRSPTSIFIISGLTIAGIFLRILNLVSSHYINLSFGVLCFGLWIIAFLNF